MYSLDPAVFVFEAVQGFSQCKAFDSVMGVMCKGSELHFVILSQQAMSYVRIIMWSAVTKLKVMTR